MTDATYEFQIVADDYAWHKAIEDLRDELPPWPEDWGWFSVDHDHEMDERTYRVRFPNATLSLGQFLQLAAALVRLNQSFFVTIEHGRHRASYGLQPIFRDAPYVAIQVDEGQVNAELAERVDRALDILSGRE